MKVVLLIGILSLFSCTHTSPEPEHKWLSGDEYERIDKVAEHLRGNDVAMWEVNFRYNQLYKAIESENKEFALYQLKKIQLTMTQGAERRPKRKASYDWFIANAIPPMKKALESEGDSMTAYKSFTNQCITCHSMEKVPFIQFDKPWEMN